MRIAPAHVIALVSTAIVVAGPAVAQPVPRTGQEVLQRMHDAYAGKWYRTLTFVQKTTQYRNGTPTVSTWYESLRHTSKGVELRIDMGAPAAGNGVLYTADSSWVVRGGKVTAARAQGNEFLPLIEGVYVQAVSLTADQVKAFGVDLSKVSTGTLDGRSVWIVGAASAVDSTAMQFWVDPERMVLVRMTIAGGQRGALDVRLGGYERTGSGWLATRVAMSAAGAPVQTEEYSDWKSDVDLSPALFDVSTWTTAPHWVKP